MKYLTIVFAVVFFSLMAIAQTATPTPAPVASPNVFQSIFTWVMSHQAVLGGFVVGVLDLLFALNPNSQSNGILHFLYTSAQKLKSGSDQQQPPQTPAA